MTKSKRENFLQVLRISFVFVCMGGFLFQSTEFMLLYWTYPTVVDIQQIAPSNLEVPAFTFCNSVGYKYPEFCSGFPINPCTPPVFNSPLAEEVACKRFPAVCFDGKFAENFTIIKYKEFMQGVQLTAEDHDRLRVELRDFMQCEIEIAEKKLPCDMENVLGSLYSKDDLPQYCYTIYSLWGNPEKKRTLLSKGAIMKLHFFMNQSVKYKKDGTMKPEYSLPSSPSIQIAVHSPYFLPSPYLEGSNYLGGRAYELRLTMSETHLLPFPYQTNCTDYMTVWRERQGKAPINQLAVVQECRLNITYEKLGCVPLYLDYPHQYDTCETCSSVCNGNSADECTFLADSYNQPCYSITYHTTKEDKEIIKYKTIDSNFLGNNELTLPEIIHPKSERDAYGIFSPPLMVSSLNIGMEMSTPNRIAIGPVLKNAGSAKSLEVFSVIGGYMGMWLGISFLTVYDFVGSTIRFINVYFKRKRELREARLHPESKRKRRSRVRYSHINRSYQN
ncbi:uncharacterized protein LOC129228330 [Uloborus diversus]|uniref:uncharacterized protein LOC129228330 n=1 Tax=Uloborus diversus TaxID=327109 RepID=UPI00240A2B52|nr:uncharacterized protein LOC129228330 [Uloborus diversus]